MVEDQIDPRCSGNIATANYYDPFKKGGGAVEERNTVIFYTDDVKGDYERIKARGGDVLNQRLISSKALVEAAGGLLSPPPHSPPA
jgi:hypothetical protein